MTVFSRGADHPQVDREDWGLQPERVELAWRRTFLALAGTISLGIRATDHEFGVFSVFFGVFAFALVAIGSFVHRSRARQQLLGFHSEHKLAKVNALPIALVGVAVVLMALVAVAWFVLRLIA